MDITGKINVNKKRYGKYVPQGQSGEISFGKKKKDRKISFSKNAYVEIAGLNDLDANLLKENFEDKINKPSLRIELQLEKAENKLQKVKEEMQSNQILNINTPENDKKLKTKKERIEKEIAFRRNEYRSLGLPYKIVDTVSQINQSLKRQVLAAKEFLVKLTPSAKGREHVKFAKILDKKLTNEMNKPASYNPGGLEPLLFEAEKLNKVKF